jgi:hypothetical protein
MIEGIAGGPAMTHEPLPALSTEWRERAFRAAESFGFGALADLPDHRWQKVLSRVEQGMRSQGINPPKGWRVSLARQVGRPDR